MATTKAEVVAAVNAALIAAQDLDDQSSQIVALQAQLTTANTLATDRRNVIDAMKAKIEEAQSADVQEQAADTAGDAARAEALALANAAP